MIFTSFEEIPKDSNIHLKKTLVRVWLLNLIKDIVILLFPLIKDGQSSSIVQIISILNWVQCKWNQTWS
jgi:hypothetical protein